MSTTATRERPIIFTGDSVRAILAGTKSQTRRVIQPQPSPRQTSLLRRGEELYWASLRDSENAWAKLRQPYCVGSRLWVREKLIQLPDREGWSNSPYVRTTNWHYAADNAQVSMPIVWTVQFSISRTISPQHMPRWVARLTLEVTDIRVERIRDISKEDVIAEGFPFHSDRDAFSAAWDRDNGKRPGCSWADNPWVFVLTFRRVAD